MNKSYSAQLAPFLALLVAILGVGVYVQGRDIKTEVKSADQSLFPQTYTDATTGLELTYPNDWTVGSDETGTINLQPNEDEETSIQVTTLLQPIEQIGANPPIELGRAKLELYRTRDGRVGYTTTVVGSTEAGQTGSSTRYIWLPTTNNQTLQVALTTDANNLNDYQETLEGVARSINSNAPEALVLSESYSNESMGISFQYPEAYEIDDSQVNRVIVTDPASQATMQIFQRDSHFVARLSPFRLTETPAEMTPLILMEALSQRLINESGFSLVEPVSESNLGDNAGATVLLFDGLANYWRGSVYQVGEDRWLATVLQGSSLAYPAIEVNADEMLDSITFSEPVVVVPEALPLPQSYSNEILGITFQYPETYEVENTDFGTLSINDSTNPNVNIQLLQQTPARSLELLQLAASTELTPQAALEAFIAANASVIIVDQPVTQVSHGSLNGASTVLVSEGGDGSLTNRRFTIYEITPERWIMVIITDNQETYPVSAATIDSMMTGVTFSDPVVATPAPLTLTQTYTSAEQGISFAYPEHFSLDDSQTGQFVLVDPTREQGGVIQIYTFSPEITAGEIFGNQTPIDELTPLMVLETFAPNFVASNPSRTLVEEATESTVGTLSGASMVISQTQTEGTPITTKIGIYEANPDLWVTISLTDNPEFYPFLNTAVEEMLAGMTFGETTTVEPTEEPTAEPTEGATEEATTEPTEEATSEATEEATAEPTEEATGEVSALPLTQEYTSEALGITLQYPEGFAIDNLTPNAITVINPANDITQIQFFPETPANTPSLVFNLTEPLEEVTPEGVLTAFLDAIIAQSPALSLEQPVSATTMAGMNGASAVVINASAAPPIYVQVTILEVSAEKWLTFIIVENQADFATLSLTVEEMLATMTFGETATTEPTEEATAEATEVATEEATTEPTAEATEVATEEATTEPTAEATEVATEEATAEPTEEAAIEGTPTAEPLALGDETASNNNIKLTVAVPEGFTARNLLSFLFVESETVSIRMTIDTVRNVASANLGLQLETLPNNDVAVNLLQSYVEEVTPDYDFVTGITSFDDGNRAYVDLTREENKTRVYLQALEDGRVLFADVTAPTTEFDTVASTLMSMVEGAIIEPEE